MDKAAQKCGSHIIKDTVRITDTLITKQVRRDTIFQYNQHDSVIVREGKLVMKYYYNSHDSTVYLQGKCLPDTVIKTVEVIVDKTVLEVDWWAKFKWYIIIGGIIFALLYALKLYKK